MTISPTPPLSSQSEVVNERRRWAQDWYTWISDLVALPFVISTVAGPVTPVIADAKLQIYENDPGDHAGEQHATVLIQTEPVGSGENSTSSIDVSLWIQAAKQGYPVKADTVHGQIDGIYVQLRQTGPTDGTIGDSARSDAAAILTNCYNVGKTGFIAGSEMVIGNIADDGTTVLKEMDVQIGAVNADTTSPFAIGFSAIADIGALDYAYNVGTNGATWGFGFHAAPTAITPGGFFISYDGFFTVDDVGAVVGGAATFTGDLDVSGNAVFNSGSAVPARIVKDGFYNTVTLNGVVAFPGVIGISGVGGGDPDLYHYSQGAHQFYSGNTSVFSVDSSGNLHLSMATLVNAANDAAAAGAGATVGQVYRNGSVLMVRVT